MVFLIHCHDDVIPHCMTHFDEAEMDEERRLLRELNSWSLDHDSAMSTNSWVA